MWVLQLVVSSDVERDTELFSGSVLLQPHHIGHRSACGAFRDSINDDACIAWINRKGEWDRSYKYMYSPNVTHNMYIP